jgi:hypothetical protein
MSGEIHVIGLISDTHGMVRAFASEWLRLNDTPQHPALEKLTKNGEKFPSDSAALRDAMRTESEHVYERAFFADGPSFRALLTGTEAYVESGTEATTWARSWLDGWYGPTSSTGPQPAVCLAWAAFSRRSAGVALASWGLVRANAATPATRMATTPNATFRLRRLLAIFRWSSTR